MATKPASDPQAHIAFLLSAFNLHDGELKIDWNEVAKQNGIGYGRNAASKFKDTLKKYGYKFENGKVEKVGGAKDQNAVAVAAPATPKTRAPPRAKKDAVPSGGKGGGKKRKLDPDADADDVHVSEDVDEVVD